MSNIFNTILKFFKNLFKKQKDIEEEKTSIQSEEKEETTVEEDIINTEDITISSPVEDKTISEETNNYIMKHFTIDELCMSTTAKRKGIDNEPTEEVKAHLTELVEKILDPLREAWRAPIVVTSGYRSPELNKAIGGSATSAHMTGYAADIHPSNLKNKKFLEFTLKFLKEKNIAWDQVINEYPDKNGNPSWIHIGIKNAKGEQRRQEKVIK